MIRVTDLIDYLICPRKVYIKRVLGIEEEKTEEMIRGEFIHEFLNIFDKEEEEIVYEILEPLPFEKILNLYKEKALEIIDRLKEKYKINFDDVWNYIEFELIERAKNVYNFMTTYDVYGIELWENLEPKIKSEVELYSERYDLVGRVDRIEIYKSFIVPVEIKTGKERYSYLHKIQLAAYKMLLEENFPNKKIEDGYVYYPKTGKKIFVKSDGYKYKIKEIITKK